MKAIQHKNRKSGVVVADVVFFEIFILILPRSIFQVARLMAGLNSNCNTFASPMQIHQLGRLVHIYTKNIQRRFLYVFCVHYIYIDAYISYMFIFRYVSLLQIYQHIYFHASKIWNKCTLQSDSKNIENIFSNMAFPLSLSIGHKVQDLCDIYVSFYTLKVENNKNFPRSHCQLSKLTFWNRLFISNSHSGKTTS